MRYNENIENFGSNRGKTVKGDIEDMKTHKNWSYHPYKPPCRQNGDIYICRVVPSLDSIHLEWLDSEEPYQIYVRKKDTDEFTLAGETNKTEFMITGLEMDTDYEFYVASGEKKSRVRLARCGEAIDTVVNYLHPEDKVYAFSGNCLCSPSLIRHPDGYLLASMDVYGHAKPQNLTLIFRSDDDGKTWHYVSELFPCFWGRLFVYEKDVYMIACSTEYGDLLIGKSTDGAKTFCEPTVLLRGGNGKNNEAGVHKNPQPVVAYNGRLWNTMEWGAWGQPYCHAVMVMSAKIGSDLLDADSWLFSEPVKYDPTWEGVPEGRSGGNIEGCLVVHEDKFYNIMRYDMTKMTPPYGYVLAYEVNTEDPEAPLRYDHPIKFPANHSKFQMKYDEKRKKYYSIASLIKDAEHKAARDTLALMESDDLKHWKVERIIHERDNKEKIGFQYVDFYIEDDRIIYLCRTAINGAENFHNSNYSTFGILELPQNAN